MLVEYATHIIDDGNPSNKHFAKKSYMVTPQKLKLDEKT